MMAKKYMCFDFRVGRRVDNDPALSLRKSVICSSGFTADDDSQISVSLAAQGGPPGTEPYYISIDFGMRKPLAGAAALSLDQAKQLGEHLDLLSAIGMGETILQSPPRIKTYHVSLDEIILMADVTAKLDDIKNLLPATHDAVREAAVLVNRAHSTLERILGDDVAQVYAPEESEVTPS